MVKTGIAQLVGTILTVGVISISGMNLAFAQQIQCGTAPYGEAPFAYIGCTPLHTAQTFGAIAVAAIVAFAVGWGIHGRQYHTIP